MVSDSEGNTSPCDQQNVDNSPNKDCHIEEVLSIPINETKEHSTEPVTEQETEQQEDHKNVIRDNGVNKDSGVDKEETEEESETVKILEEKADDVESSEEMEGLEEQGKSTPTEESGEVKVNI